MDLTELRKRLQEDIIWYFACDGGDDGITIAEVLQIIDYCFPESTSAARMPYEDQEIDPEATCKDYLQVQQKRGSPK